MTKRVLIVALFMFSINALFGPVPASSAGAQGPCWSRSWIPRTGMPTAEKEWRLILLVDCAVERWWPGAGHARAALSIAERESCLSCTYAVNYGGCGGSNCYGAWQHSGNYWRSRWSFYLDPAWFGGRIPGWQNARAQAIVTVRMMAAQGGVCPAWC